MWQFLLFQQSQSKHIWKGLGNKLRTSYYYLSNSIKKVTLLFPGKQSFTSRIIVGIWNPGSIFSHLLILSELLKKGQPSYLSAPLWGFKEQCTLCKCWHTQDSQMLLLVALDEHLQIKQLYAQTRLPQHARHQVSSFSFFSSFLDQNWFLVLSGPFPQPKRQWGKSLPRLFNQNLS